MAIDINKYFKFLEEFRQKPINEFDRSYHTKKYEETRDFKSFKPLLPELEDQYFDVFADKIYK